MTAIRIGTRGSQLALAQAEEVKARLEAAHGHLAGKVSIEVIQTTGDKVLDRPLSEIGGKGLFTKEIEEQLTDGRIDIAVHSSKDMPTVLPEGLGLTCFLPREAVADAFLSPVAESLEALPQGAVVGSASLRRQALIRRLRPDIEVVTFRGNVQTRLRKLDEGQVAATILAEAGLRRLDLTARITTILDPDRFPPAPGQGAICIESRLDDEPVRQLLEAIHHTDTGTALACERAFLAGLDGSCRTPIAGHARRDGENLVFDGMILSPDGKKVHETSRSGAAGEAVAMGQDAAAELRRRAGDGFFADWS